MLGSNTFSLIALVTLCSHFVRNTVGLWTKCRRLKVI